MDDQINEGLCNILHRLWSFNTGGQSRGGVVLLIFIWDYLPRGGAMTFDVMSSPEGRVYGAPCTLYRCIWCFSVRGNLI